MDNEEKPIPKRKKSRNTKPSYIKQPLELQEDLDLQKMDCDSEEMEQVNEVRAEQKSRRSSHSSPKHKKHSRRKSSGRKQVPETFITAVLEELGDDMVDEPPRRDTGDCSVVEPVLTPSSHLPDKVYVERKNGFTTTPRVKMFHPLRYDEEDLRDMNYSKSVTTPLELAILVQKCCRPLYTLFHGLLGGMALLHIIFVYGAGSSYGEENFVHMYGHYARVYQTLFHFLSIFCLISIMDRCDAKRLKHLMDVFRYSFSTVLVLTVYLVTVVLTFVTTKWDDWLALSSSAYNISDVLDMVSVWKNLNLCRSIGAISGWTLVSLFPAEDMLHTHLCSMKTATVPSARY